MYHRKQGQHQALERRDVQASPRKLAAGHIARATRALSMPARAQLLLVLSLLLVPLARGIKLAIPAEQQECVEQPIFEEEVEARSRSADKLIAH